MAVVLPRLGEIELPDNQGFVDFGHGDRRYRIAHYQQRSWGVYEIAIRRQFPMFNFVERESVFRFDNERHTLGDFSDWRKGVLEQLP